MAQRRMFSKQIIDTDIFLDMPVSSQLLYFHLSMRADDDGFVSSPKKIMKIVNCSDDDFRVLIMKNFIIPFESGICVIIHWRIHNYIQKDRYNETLYKSEKSLIEDVNGAYEISHSEPMDTKCIQDVSSSDTQVRLGKVRLELGKVSKEEPSPSKTTKEVKHKYGQFNHVLLTDTEYKSLTTDFKESLILEFIKKVDEYIEQYGKKGYKNYNLTIRSWIKRDNGGSNNGSFGQNTKTGKGEYTGFKPKQPKTAGNVDYTELI